MARIVLKDLETEQAFSVQDLEGIIGRDPACSFVIEGPKSKVVSGRHARIFFADSGWWIEDSSRNGTILDDERLQSGQRHEIRVGQIVGLGESGPRLRVAVLESRKMAETLMEVPAPEAATAVVSTTAPRSKRSREPAEPNYPDNTSALPALDSRKSPLRIEEPTEPMSPAPDWLVQISLRLASTNQLFESTSRVVRVGRSPDNNIQIPPELGVSVSRRHSEVAIEGGGVVVRDAGSRNGTYLNGKRIDEATPIAKGDQVMLGSGGPTLAVEDLHIVRGQGTESSGGGGSDRTPSEPTKRRDGFVEPRTDPSPIVDKGGGGGPKRASPTPVLEHRSFGGVGRTAFFKDVLDDMSEKSARRVRVVVWASVVTTVLIAVTLLAVTQWRVAASEERIASEQRRYEARADSIRVAASAEAARLRAAFDSARASSAPRSVLDSLRNALADASRRTGVLEVALMRARESLDLQIASRDSARRAAEQEMTRLRAELGKTGTEIPSNSVDSLRRALRVAEERATDVANQVRTVRGANLAQVAQLNQSAVGLLVSFVGDRVVSGSGFAITPSGYFVTNRHVVTDDSGRVRDSIYVTMADQRFTLAHRVQVVGIGSRDLDIAVVKIPDYRGPYMKRVDWTAAGASQGEPAALIGFPYGVELAFDDTTSNVVRTSMSAGIFSKVSTDRIQFDGFTVNGSSGSPIFNAAGEVVAVHRAGFSAGAGLGFSIPVSRVVAILPPDARSELGIR